MSCDKFGADQEKRKKKTNVQRGCFFHGGNCVQSEGTRQRVQETLSLSLS